MGIIEIKGMEFHSFIGHYDEEKQIGNNFKVDVRLWYDHSKAANTDRLTDALDYQLVYDLVKEQMQQKCNLIENVAQRILNTIVAQFPQLNQITVKVRKLFPKLGGMVEEVSIELEKKLNL